MIVAIMQPYFFPYIGYFQLMKAVDTFVFFDDVQYVDRSWINRNRIPIAGALTWLTMPVKRAPRTLAINKREYILEDGIAAVRRKLDAAYPKRRKSPESRIIDQLLDFPDPNVGAFNSNHLLKLAKAFGIKCDFTSSSVEADTSHLRSQKKVIELCSRLGATHYINPIGGYDLYDSSEFMRAGVKLSYLRTAAMPSLTSAGQVHPSIIDLLIRGGLMSCSQLLNQYELLGPPSKDHQ